MCIMESMSEAKIIVWERGFQYKLENGYTLSCAFGHGNYCSNRNDSDAEVSKSQRIESEDMEVAVFEPNGMMVDLIKNTDSDGDTWTDQVIGHVPASRLPALIQALKFWPVREKWKIASAFEKTFRARCRMFLRIAQPETKSENTNV